MHQMYKRQRTKIIKTQSNYNLDYVSPWDQQQKIPQINNSEMPTHRKIILTSFMNQIFRKNKKTIQERQGLTISQYLRQKNPQNIGISTQNVLEMHSSQKKCKTENTFDKIFDHPKILNKRKSFTSSTNKKQSNNDSLSSGNKVSVVNLNETSSYFEQWQTRFIKKRQKQRAFRYFDDQKNIFTLTHKNFKSNQKSDKNYKNKSSFQKVDRNLFTVHKYLKAQAKNKAQKQRNSKKMKDKVNDEAQKQKKQTDINNDKRKQKKSQKLDFRYFLKKFK